MTSNGSAAELLTVVLVEEDGQKIRRTVNVILEELGDDLPAIVAFGNNDLRRRLNASQFDKLVATVGVSDLDSLPVAALLSHVRTPWCIVLSGQVEVYPGFVEGLETYLQTEVLHSRSVVLLPQLSRPENGLGDTASMSSMVLALADLTDEELLQSAGAVTSLGGAVWSSSLLAEAERQIPSELRGSLWREASSLAMNAASMADQIVSVPLFPGPVSSAEDMLTWRTRGSASDGLPHVENEVASDVDREVVEADTAPPTEFLAGLEALRVEYQRLFGPSEVMAAAALRRIGRQAGVNLVHLLDPMSHHLDLWSDVPATLSAMIVLDERNVLLGKSPAASPDVRRVVETTFISEFFADPGAPEFETVLSSKTIRFLGSRLGVDATARAPDSSVGLLSILGAEIAEQMASGAETPTDALASVLRRRVEEGSDLSDVAKYLVRTEVALEGQKAESDRLLRMLRAASRQRSEAQRELATLKGNDQGAAE